MQLIGIDYEPLPRGDTGNVPMTRIHIVTPDPDPDMGGRSDGYVDLADAAINGAATTAALWTLIKQELGRMYRRTAVKAKMDAWVGTTETV